jgi:integrase
MASVFRQTYKRPVPEGAEIVTRKGKRLAKWKDERGRTKTAPLSKDGTKIVLEYRNWYVAYSGPDGRRVVVKGYTDREATEQLARDQEKLAARIKRGLVTVEMGKEDTTVATALDAYLVDMERLDRDETYRYNIRHLVEKMAREMGWTTLDSIRSDPLLRWLAAMREKGRAPRTLNEYLCTAQTFLAWCVRQRYLEGNPLAHLERSDESDKRRLRRALTPEQLQAFLRQCGERRNVYLTAALSGLRGKELRLLQWGDLRLDGEQPYIQLRARATKAKRADVLPVNEELRELLLSIRPDDATPSTSVFSSVPVMRTYKRDLAAAGIVYKDEQGRQADFHALRMAFGTYLQRAGVPIRVAMQLMRHSDIRLTAKVYTDPSLLDTAGAVAKLPRLGDGSQGKGEDGKAGGQKAAG